MAEHVLEDMLNVLCDIFLSRTHKTGSWYLLGVKNISSYTHKTGSGTSYLGVKNTSSHAHKTGSWYLLGVKKV